MRLGVLDVGSNTIHLQVMDAHPGARPTPATNFKTELRLIEHLNDSGEISSEGILLLHEAVKGAVEHAHESKTEEILAFATSAIRDAKNGTEIIKNINLEFDIDLQIMSGDEEARMTFLAARRWLGWSAGRLLVVDIGGGTTEVAVISLGGVVTSLSIRTGGDELDDALIQFVKKEYSLMLGERTAEEIKTTVGTAFPTPDETSAELRGRDLVTGLPRTIVVTAEEIRRALDEPLTRIVDAVKTTLDRTPPELCGDIMDRGIVLTGGGALLKGLDERLRHETGMPVIIAEQPLNCVVMGSGKCVEEFEALQQVLISEPRG